MKKVLVLLTVLLNSVIIYGNSINSSSKLESAKVFLNGAELTHSADVEIPGKGVFEIVFDGFAANINSKSLQVSADGDLLILSVKSRVNYLKANEKTNEIISLEDSLKELNYEKMNQKNESEILELEIELLDANKELKGEEKNITVKEIQLFSKFYVERLREIKKAILKVDMKIQSIEKRIDRITKQLNELNRRINQPSSEVVVNVNADKAGKYKFQVTYLNYTAGWNPLYDIRAKNINSPVVLNYKAEVFQNTGLEWKDAKIILSTRNPGERGNKPELYTWYLDFRRTADISWEKRGGAQMMKSMSADVVDEVSAAPPSLEEFIGINETQLAVEFIPEINYTIPSDGKRHTIALREYNLSAEYEYYAAPKIDKDAFLVAYVSEWKELNLLPGIANIYFENSYVGQSALDPFTTEKKLTVSLGRDKNILIERKILKDYTEDKFLSSDVERQFAYEIRIKNNKKNKVKLILEDQYPVSKNENIEVELQNDGGAEVNKTKGTLKWNIDLDASQEINKQFVYSVRYPADKAIQGL